MSIRVSHLPQPSVDRCPERPRLGSDPDQWPRGTGGRVGKARASKAVSTDHRPAGTVGGSARAGLARGDLAPPARTQRSGRIDTDPGWQGGATPPATVS